MQQFKRGQYVAKDGLSNRQVKLIAESMVHDGFPMYHDTSLATRDVVRYFGIDKYGDFRVSRTMRDFGTNGVLLDSDDALLRAQRVCKPKVGAEDSTKLAEFLYNARLGQGMIVDDVEYTRVPGGWVIAGAFVPYDKEFCTNAVMLSKGLALRDMEEDVA